MPEAANLNRTKKSDRQSPRKTLLSGDPYIESIAMMRYCLVVLATYITFHVKASLFFQICF